MSLIVGRFIFDTSLVAAILFAGAGTLHWPRAWTLLVLMLCVRGLGAAMVYRVHPELLRQRARLPGHVSQESGDRALLLAVLATGFLGVPLIAALDVWRWQFFSPPHVAISGFGVVMFGAGWALKSVALRANAYAVAEVRPQRDRGHALADRGIYNVIRHPFYAADFLILVGQGLWLASYVAALASVVPIALMLYRLQSEEQFLRRELPGYGAYARRVPHRLIPGVW